MSKTLKKVRALPSDASANDVLKVEYIEVNLNNSRKLISGIKSASTLSKEASRETEATLDDMIRLQSVRAELSWLDSVAKYADPQR